MKGEKRSTSDIISYLPSHVTENILKELSLRDAVRTSVLSSRWRFKWVTLPHLVFDNNLFVKSWDSEKLKAVICHILLSHQGPLIKFELCYPPFESYPDINNWIFMLLKKNIQEFSFSLYWGPHHEIPCHVFSFLQLRDMDLYKCTFKLPPTFIGFSRLVNLNLRYVILAPETFGRFISNCPLLEHLRLFDCTQFDFLEINNPNLKDFTFCGEFKSIAFKNTPFLAVISIALLSWDTNVKQPEEETDSEWVKFFHCLPAAIKDLHLDSSFLESLAAGHVPERIPSTLNHLKDLYLSDICFYSLDHVSCVLCLLNSSPDVRLLNISILNTTPIQDPVMEFLQVQDFSKFSLNKLRKARICHFSGSKPEMQFVRILLAHSQVLEKLVILHEQETSYEKGFGVLKELTRFPRASSKAEVVFDVASDD